MIGVKDTIETDAFLSSINPSVVKARVSASAGCE